MDIKDNSRLCVLGGIGDLYNEDQLSMTLFSFCLLQGKLSGHGDSQTEF